VIDHSLIRKLIFGKEIKKDSHLTRERGIYIWNNWDIRVQAPFQEGQAMNDSLEEYQQAVNTGTL